MREFKPTSRRELFSTGAAAGLAALLVSGCEFLENKPHILLRGKREAGRGFRKFIQRTGTGSKSFPQKHSDWIECRVGLSPGKVDCEWRCL